MSQRIEWATARECHVSVTDEGETMGDGQSVEEGWRGLCVGDELVIEGSNDDLLQLWVRIGKTLAHLAPEPTDPTPAVTLAQVRELLTESDWSGVLYDNDVLGAVAELVGVERQD